MSRNNNIEDNDYRLLKEESEGIYPISGGPSEPDSDMYSSDGECFISRKRERVDRSEESSEEEAELKKNMEEMRELKRRNEELREKIRNKKKGELRMEGEISIFVRSKYRIVPVERRLLYSEAPKCILCMGVCNEEVKETTTFWRFGAIYIHSQCVRGYLKGIYTLYSKVRLPDGVVLLPFDDNVNENLRVMGNPRNLVCSDLLESCMRVEHTLRRLKNLEMEWMETEMELMGLSKEFPNYFERMREKDVMVRNERFERQVD